MLASVASVVILGVAVSGNIELTTYTDAACSNAIGSVCYPDNECTDSVIAGWGYVASCSGGTLTLTGYIGDATCSGQGGDVTYPTACSTTASGFTTVDCASSCTPTDIDFGGDGIDFGGDGEIVVGGDGTFGGEGELDFDLDSLLDLLTLTPDASLNSLTYVFYDEADCGGGSNVQYSLQTGCWSMDVAALAAQFNVDASILSQAGISGFSFSVKCGSGTMTVGTYQAAGCTGAVIEGSALTEPINECYNAPEGEFGPASAEVICTPKDEPVPVTVTVNLVVELPDDVNDTVIANLEMDMKDAIATELGLDADNVMVTITEKTAAAGRRLLAKEYDVAVTVTEQSDNAVAALELEGKAEDADFTAAITTAVTDNGGTVQGEVSVGATKEVTDANPRSGGAGVTLMAAFGAVVGSMVLLLA